MIYVILSDGSELNWELGEKVPKIWQGNRPRRYIDEMNVDSKRSLDILRSFFEDYPVLQGIFLGASVRPNRTTAVFNEEASQVIYDILAKEYGTE